MGRYITTKADFTLRRKHKKGLSGTTVYENDYTTINPMPNAMKGEYVIGDSNFVFTSRLGINGQKKHVRGKFVPNPSGSTDENGAWTIDTIVDSGITDETKIRLKPNYNSIRDFACYGSAVKLVQGTVNGVIRDFPAEMYLSDETITLYKLKGGNGYSFDSEENGKAEELNRLYNEYQIDITTENVKPESVINQLRFFALCGSSYNYIDQNGDVYDFSGFTVSSTSIGSCYQGKSVWIDKLADVDISFKKEDGNEEKKITVSIFKNYDDDSLIYTYSGGSSDTRIRPKKKIVEDYFKDCDDFTATLLNRETKPIYRATFETPRETDTGFFYDMKDYVWPTLYGGFNPDLSGPYYAYVESLMSLGDFYDEYFSDNMWRSLTHEAIKTLDWTYVSNTDGDVEDMSTIDTSRIEPITKIYGRQFDDLKRYADGIKTINTITYDQKSNTPDYTLTDVLENSGWETKTLKITSDNDIRTESLYSGLTSGYTSSDTNNEFLRRLKLNSQYLLSIKGTRKGLDTMLAMFGFEPKDYSVSEYVYVFSGKTFPHFCDSTIGNDNNVSYPLAKDVATINKYKVNFDSYDPYGDYCGIPVAEIGYSVNGKDCSYVVPWFSYGKKYDDGLYFQKHGGWGKRKEMDIDLEIAPSVTSISGNDLYMETQARLKFAKDFDDLLQEAFSESNLHDVFYVTDISRIGDTYSSGPVEEDISAASHYFVLENIELNQFLGYSYDYTGETKYGWRSIATNEIEPNPNTAGTLVLYLESIQDDTTGNNPHIGNGTYDDGMAYISGMSEIFAYSLLNKNFIGINDATCENISGLTFDVTKQEDNRKCWFFSDNYNSGYGKNVCISKVGDSPCCTPDTNVETIELREVDITSGVCALHNCNDSSEANSGCTGGLYYDLIGLLSDTAATNEEVLIGVSAKTYFLSGETYGRTSKLVTFDPEKERKDGENGEAQANSVVNVKNLDITFNIPTNFETDDVKKAFRQYVETSVLPYLTQMIPSTSILSWTFNKTNTETTEAHNG